MFNAEQHSALGRCTIAVANVVCQRRAHSHLLLTGARSVSVCRMHEFVLRQRNVILGSHPQRGSCGLPATLWRPTGCEVPWLTDAALEAAFPSLST